MTDASAPPLVHLGLGAIIAMLLIVGGSVTFGSWGTVPVRLVALYALAAVTLHAASTRVPKGGLVVRAAAWGVVLGAPLHVRPLLRPEVLLPAAAIAAVDMALARAQLSADLDVDPGTAGKVVAGVTSLAAIVLLGLLIPLAQDALILARLGTVIVTGWALVATLSLRPALRTPGTLLGAAGALSLTFLLLAAPVVPFGPLLAYWVLVLSTTLAVVTVTFTDSDTPLDERHTRHEQTVRPLPDPVLAPLADRIERFIETGQGAQALSTRVEHALDRDEDGTLLPAMCETISHGTKPSRADRRRALAELVGVPTEHLDGDPP